MDAKDKDAASSGIFTDFAVLPLLRDRKGPHPADDGPRLMSALLEALAAKKLRGNWTRC